MAARLARPATAATAATATAGTTTATLGGQVWLGHPLEATAISSEREEKGEGLTVGIVSTKSASRERI